MSRLSFKACEEPGRLLNGTRPAKELDHAVGRYRAKGRNARIFTDAANMCRSRFSSSTAAKSSRTGPKANGYTAVQLGMAAPRSRMSPRRNVGISPWRRSAQDEARRVSSDEAGLLPVGAEITADHFVVGQFVEVTGTPIGKGFAGPMKRWTSAVFAPLTAFRFRIVRMVRPAAARIQARPSRTRRWPAIWARTG